jgi:hypothetical protein
MTSLLTFFATGLGALSLVSVESARRWQAGPAAVGAWPSLNRYWLSTVAGVISSLLLLGLLLAALLSPNLFVRLNDALSAAANVATIVVLVVLGAILVVVAWLLGPLLEQIALSLGDNPFRLPSLPEIAEQAPQAIEFFERHPVLNFMRQGLVLAVLVAILGLVFWWAVRRMARLNRGDADEQRESIATRQLLLEQLRNLLRRRPKTGAAGPPYFDLDGPRDDPRLMVRRAYQAMLAWTLSRSLPRRRAGQTPVAYAKALAVLLPTASAPLDTLAQIYAQARYAGQPPTLAEARAAQSALAEIQAAGL